MISNKISIKRILELKGGSLEELQQYAKTKGICLPDDLTYCLTSTELKAIDYTLFCGQGIEHNIPSDTKGCSELISDREKKRNDLSNFKDVLKKDNKFKESRYYIGAVKFFDRNKDFGFIASNNCNMPTTKYNQDFYVNSYSFVDEYAKAEESIVVFQIKMLAKGKNKAINVRLITQSDEDINLALSYYGEHECFECNDGKKINLFTHYFIPVNFFAKRVQSIIENDSKRSPETTLKHFQFYIRHYPQDSCSKDKYVFDRQFHTESKSIWKNFLFALTDEERLAIIHNYPSIVKYFDDENLINLWINEFFNEKRTLADVQLLMDNFDFIPSACLDLAKQVIEKFADGRIINLLEELSKRSDLEKSDFSPTNNRSNFVVYGTLYREKLKVIHELQSYLNLTSRSYDKEIEECIASNKVNRFKQKINDFLANPSNQYSRDALFNYLSTLSNAELQGEYKKAIKGRIIVLLDRYIDEKSYFDAAYVIKQFLPYNYDFLSSYIPRLYPLNKDFLSELLRKNLGSVSYLKTNFFSLYELLTSIFKQEECFAIKQYLVSILKETNSIEVLSLFSDKYHQWLSIDDALLLAKQQIVTWNYNQMREFVKSPTKLFDNDIRFAEIVIGKSFELIEKIPLSHFFDGTPLDDKNISNLSRLPERENCAFLNSLKELIPANSECSLWNSYVKSRKFDDQVALFDNGVIDDLPESVIDTIINSISLSSVYVENNRWYNKPVLQNKVYENILKTTSVDFFHMISNRLLAMDLSESNIPLAVLLAELLSYNKPNESDYQTLKKWETHFNSQLNEFKHKIPSSKSYLSAIMWAVYFQTKTSMAALSNIFSSLPPYLQIKSVKKIFQLISQGKIKYSAEKLYNLITNGEKRLCLPLEITFAYLKQREKDPKSTLDNKIMLQLLNDREDHAEWIGIRQLVTECYGRWEATPTSSSWKLSRYVNGIIYKEQNGEIRMLVPTKMIDQNNFITKFNNKYFNQIQELINLTYTSKDYRAEKLPQEISYYFDKKFELELFSIARTFNFKINSLGTSIGNYLNFEKKEDEADVFCECRMADKVDGTTGISFYWCGNKTCFRTPIRYMLDSEWEHYTILDFMRILQIPVNYTNKLGKTTRFGHYIILSSYLKYFRKFYEHLKCRECGNLMKPTSGITNFTTRAVNQFACINEQCVECGKIVYLNHCFNKLKCNATIDSRDSKMCPNWQYICPECGACCSTENFRKRIANLIMTGGDISPRLYNFVQHNLGHWEKNEFYCYKCGKKMEIRNDGSYVCSKCGQAMEKQKNGSLKYIHK